MLPITDIRIIRADSLEPGTLAHLHSHDVLIAIGRYNGACLAVILGEGKDHMTIGVGSLSGDATVISGWRIEVDHKSAANEYSGPIGSITLTVKKGNAALVVRERYGPIPIEFIDMPGTDANRVVTFSTWRIVHGEGDREVELFRGV